MVRGYNEKYVLDTAQFIGSFYAFLKSTLIPLENQEMCLSTTGSQSLHLKQVGRVRYATLPK